MENVVYILGAGFSAPLGLPVMSNFMEKAKDLYASDTAKYKHFKVIFDRINKMSYVKNFYNTNLSNIEEILSILEMEKQITSNSDDFISLIIDVIENSTPDLPKPFFSSPSLRLVGSQSTSGVLSTIFPSHIGWSKYATFVMSLFPLTFRIDDIDLSGQLRREFNCHIVNDHKYKYSIITLNYDLIPESICKILSNNISDKKFSFTQSIKDESISNEEYPYLAKLHGCIDTREIIPPTWNKGLSSDSIKTTWRLAHQLLKTAQHIRFIGYSLPVNDSYIKYLLKSAVLENQHLKRIDILCKDDKVQSVQKRYFDFIDFENKRFSHLGIEDYMDSYHDENVRRYGGSSVIEFTDLESFHERFFSKNTE